MDQPLNLPQGTVRAIVTLLVVFAYLFFVGFSIYAKVVMKVEFDMPVYLVGIVGTVIGYYFGTRATEEKNVVAATGVTTPPPAPIKYEPKPVEDTDEVKSA